MITSHRRRLLSPGEMFPSGDPAYRVNHLSLRSGLKVRSVECGDPSAPPVLFIHGWGCTAYVWRYNLPVIADAGFRTIAVDLKGHGLSDKPTNSSEYTIDSLVAHIVDILDALELEQPHLVGHSMGGSLIYHLAAAHRNRVRSLGLVSPVGLLGVPLMSIYRLMTPRWLVRVARLFPPRLIVKIALRRVYGKRGHFTERDVDEYLAPSQFPDYWSAMRELLHAYDWDAARHRELQTVEIPAATVWGTLDHMMPHHGIQIYERLIPGIQLKSVVDAGHIVPEETAREVNQAIVALFRRAADTPIYIEKE